MISSSNLFLIHRKINLEIFLSENKWLSLFFWQEFEMRTKPKCLKKIKTSDKDQSQDSDNTDNIITDRLNGSFVSINTESMSINDPTHEYKEYRNKVKAYINIFKEHVFDPDHPINVVSKYFIKIFSKYIQDKLKELHTMRNDKDPEYNKNCLIICGEITKALQKFILKLQSALRLMYSKTINYQCFIEEKDEFINLVTNLIFRDGKLYDDVYELFKLCLNDQIKILDNKFLELKSLKPETLGIHEKFCLNNCTLNFQKQLLENNKNKFIPKQKVEDEELYTTQDLLRKVDEQLLERNNYGSFNDLSPNSNGKN